MTDSIFLLQSDGSIAHMGATDYDAEVDIQRLLAQHPELIPGAQINPNDPRRWLFISREVGVPNEEHGSDWWALDHLLLDQDAIPTFIEVKRSANSQIRREVVGQMMDYAANATAYWPEHRIRELLNSRCESESIDPEELVRELLTQDEGINVNEYWERVRTNLRAGKVRLLFVADHIPAELRRIVEFLNSQMDPAEVLAVELPQYIGSEQKAIVPRVLGRTTESEVRKRQTGPTTKWTEERFFAAFEEQNDAETSASCRTIYEWATKSAHNIWWGAGSVEGSCFPRWGSGDEKCSPFALWTNGRIQMQFRYFRRVSPFDDVSVREEFRQKLDAIDGVNIPSDAINGIPAFDISELNIGSRFDEFKQSVEWFIDRFENAQID
jgi:hypothetical protein